MATQYQYIPRTDPYQCECSFWDGTGHTAECILSEPRQSPTLTGDNLTRAESRIAAIADVLSAISGPFAPIGNRYHCASCERNNAIRWQDANLT